MIERFFKLFDHWFDTVDRGSISRDDLAYLLSWVLALILLPFAVLFTLPFYIIGRFRK